MEGAASGRKTRRGSRRKTHTSTGASGGAGSASSCGTARPSNSRRGSMSTRLGCTHLGTDNDRCQHVWMSARTCRDFTHLRTPPVVEQHGLFFAGCRFVWVCPPTRELYKRVNSIVADHIDEVEHEGAPATERRRAQSATDIIKQRRSADTPERTATPKQNNCPHCFLFHDLRRLISKSSTDL